jgi:phage terminase large subunit-like protein
MTLPRPWRSQARPKQLPPDDPRHCEPWFDGEGREYRCGCTGTDDAWHIFLILTGRGFGKTWTGSNWLVDQAMAVPGAELAMLAPTFRDCRKTCFEGPTGLLRAIQPHELMAYRRNELQIRLANGSVIYGYSADEPERLRGANLAAAWCDEVGSWRYPATWYEGLIPALRIGKHPRVVVTTTPRVTGLILDLAGRDDGSVHVTRGAMWENRENLSAAAVTELERRYAGTRLGRQELEGELLEDVEGALWQRGDIEATRIRLDQVPDLARIVIAVDPAVTSGEDSDETGIVVAGEGRNSEGYVLADYSMRGSPDACMRRVVAAYHEYQADCVVAEVNNGGDYIRDLLRTVDPQVPYKMIRATRGKRLRAEPVSALYEQHRVHHVGVFPELEDQLCQWVPGTEAIHDDRLDALVYCFFELKGIAAGSWTGAYGVVYCESCSQPFLPAGREKCPHCQAPLPADDDERGLGEAA